MSHNQRTIVDFPIRCISCTKIIAQGNITVGRIVIRCKCGVENVIEARNKPEGRVDAIGRTDLMGREFVQRSVFK